MLSPLACSTAVVARRIATVDEGPALHLSPARLIALSFLGAILAGAVLPALPVAHAACAGGRRGSAS